MQRGNMGVEDMGPDGAGRKGGFAPEYGAVAPLPYGDARMQPMPPNDFDGASMHPPPNSGPGPAYGPPPPQQQPPMMTAVMCLMCLNGDVNVALDPCQHQFHIQCIERWLHKDKICPVCGIPVQSHHPILPGQYGDPSMTGPTPMDQSSTPRPGETPTSGSSMLSANATNILPAQAAANMQHPNPPAVRKGKWTAEESAYCDRLIEEFKKGNLPLAEGTTLRTFLSKLLNCDPMRISKKYTGDQCIGKIIFRQREDKLSKEDAEAIRRDLAELEKTYLEREQYNQRRREKRLESEMSRDKNRMLARQVPGMPAFGGASPAAMGGMRGPPAPLQVSIAGVSDYSQGQPTSMMGTSPAVSMTYQPQMMPTSQAPSPPTPAQMRAQMQVQGLQPPPRYPIPQQQQQQQQQQPQQQPNPGMPGQGYGPAGNVSRGMTKEEFAPASSGDVSGATMTSSMSASDLNGQGLGRVSSIDSFSCLFPRVSSVDSFGSSTNLASYGADGGDGQGGGMVKSISIGDGLSAFFPRVQSLEHLSAMLQENTELSPKDAPKSDDKAGVKEEGDAGNDSGADRRLSPSNIPSAKSPDQNQIQAPKPLNKIPRSSSGIFPRVPSMDKLPRVPSIDKLPRIPSMDKLPPIPSMDRLPRPPSMDRLPHVPSLDRLSRVSSSSDMLSRFGSSDQLSSFPSFSNLNALGGNGSSFRPTFPRNSSIEDILSLVASSESAGGLSSSASSLQLNALAAIAGEESSNLSQERKRRMENNSSGNSDSSGGDGLSLPSDVKKSRVST